MTLDADDLALIQAMIAGGAPAVGEGFPQPIVAGQQLLIPGIQSPNFSIPGAAGWAILKSGLAYFFNVVLSGGTITGPDYIINPAGAFFYSGPPAHGNLIVSIAPAAGADGFGNPYPQGINVTTGTIAGAAISGSTFTGTDFVIDAAGMRFYNGVPALGNLILALAEAAGADAFANPFPQGLMSQQLTLVNQAAGVLAVPGCSVFYSSVAGRPRYVNTAGNDSVLERSTVNVAPFVATTVTPVWSNFSSPMTYLAGEGAQSSEFEIEVIALGNWATVGPNGFTVSFFVDGASLGGTIGQQTVGIAGATVNTPFVLRLTYVLSLLGPATAVLSSHGTIAANTSGNRSQSNSMVLGSLTSAVNFDTTIAHTLQLVHNWAAAGASQTVTAFRTKLTRRM